MTRERLSQRLSEMAAAGYRPVALEQYMRKVKCYVTGACQFTTRYAVLWRQNT